MKKALLTSIFSLILTSHVWAQSLEITSDPPGCVVAINHKIVGYTPLTLEQVDPGKHLVRVAKNDAYHPFTVTLDLNENKTFKQHAVLECRTSTHLKNGITALNEGRLTEGEESLQKAVAGTPTQPQAHWWLARLAFQREQFENAYEQALSFAKVYPAHSEVHLMLGDLHFLAGRFPQAVTSYKLALLSTKEFSGSLEGLPESTWETIKEFGEPSDVRGQMQLAHLYELKGAIPQAVNLLRRAADQHFVDWPPSPLERQ